MRIYTLNGVPINKRLLRSSTELVRKLNEYAQGGKTQVILYNYNMGSGHGSLAFVATDGVSEEELLALEDRTTDALRKL